MRQKKHIATQRVHFAQLNGEMHGSCGWHFWKSSLSLCECEVNKDDFLKFNFDVKFDKYVFIILFHVFLRILTF